MRGERSWVGWKAFGSDGESDGPKVSWNVDWIVRIDLRPSGIPSNHRDLGNTLKFSLTARGVGKLLTERLNALLRRRSHSQIFSLISTQRNDDKLKRFSIQSHYK